MVYNNIPFIIGPILATFSVNYAMLMIGRIITGFAVGIASAVVPTYISEISPPQKRGALGLLRQSTITFGIMSASLIAYRLIHYNQGWRYMFLISIAPSILQLVLSYWFVETPRWLLSKDRTADAVQVLVKLDPSSTKDQVNNQIQKIYSNINQQKGDDDWFQLFKFATILQSAGFAKDMAVLISGLVGTPQMIMMFGSIWLIDRFGRRPLLLISDVGMVVGLGVLGYAFLGTAGTTGHIAESYRAWMAVGGMVFYKLAFSVGMGPIPLMVASEIYPSKIRGKAMSIVSFLNWLANFIANITFLPIQEWVGQAGSYFIFAGVTLACLIFTYLWVPETKGVTIEELSKKLVKEDNNNNDPLQNIN
ncbi:sugar transporter family protein [Cavenderia fasciculata]|uniref:Sugar transporter family protein n=1 Tax=Cavenderia fasciculata TaxID=261658 RepID=F4Q3P0_CACFS|nr:sugar transporter family protein [Cavenderia fasciculata]EGG16856.1 sugar transporter family protein [Cavenderia fasciculata]|eukprot:XP_004355330.1 sugar transporter family protein [Cavenderia fasciculata]